LFVRFCAICPSPPSVRLKCVHCGNFPPTAFFFFLGPQARLALSARVSGFLTFSSQKAIFVLFFFSLSANPTIFGFFFSSFLPFEYRSCAPPPGLPPIRLKNPTLGFPPVFSFLIESLLPPLLVRLVLLIGSTPPLHAWSWSHLENPLVGTLWFAGAIVLSTPPLARKSRANARTETVAARCSPCPDPSTMPRTLIIPPSFPPPFFFTLFYAD